MVEMFKRTLVTMIMMTMTGTMTWITIEVGLILPPTNGAIWWEGSFHSTHWWSYEQSNWRQNKKSQKWYQIGMLYFVLPRFFQYFCIDIIRQDYPIFLRQNNTLGKFFNPIIPSLFLNSIFPGGGKFAPPLVSKGVGGLWFQFLVTTSYLTQIDTRQKDLQLSDT